jgi:hypothetical protein
MSAMRTVRGMAADARRLRSGRAACKRQQSDIARALDGHAKPALVAGANAGHAPRENLAALLHELRKNVRALVINEVHLFDAELANFFLAEILPLAARTSAGTSRATAWTAFASRAAVTAGATSRTAFASRRAAMRLYWFLFLGHTFLPFSLGTR